MTSIPAECTPLHLNDLPHHTYWPQKLIEANSSVLYAKNAQEVYREYEREKWSSTFSKIASASSGIDEVDLAQFNGASQIAISVRDALYLCAPLVARKLLSAMIADRLYALCQPGDSIVELGAGTGAIIARLAKDSRFSGTTFYAGDFAPSSIEIIRHLNKVEKIAIEAALYDFNAPQSKLRIPSNSIIYFSAALACLSGIDGAFWQRIMDTKPRAVLVAEPIYSFFTEHTMLGLLRKRYYEANDYNKEILPSLEKAQSEGILRIGGLEENLIGINPLLPVSMVTLHPNHG